MNYKLCVVCFNETDEDRICVRCNTPGARCGDIEQLTLQNTDYRRVQSTTKEQQLVLMSILPTEDIPMETHPTTTQFIKVESGQGFVTLNGKRFNLRPNSFIQISAGSPHQVNVIGDIPLKLYTIYSPPEHPPSLVQHRQPIE